MNERITEEGISRYWRTIDASVRFNVLCREAFLAKKSTQNNVESVPENKVQKDPMKDFCRRHKSDNKPDYQRDSREDLHDRRLVHDRRDPSFNRFLLPRPNFNHNRR